MPRLRQPKSASSGSKRCRQSRSTEAIGKPAAVTHRPPSRDHRVNGAEPPTLLLTL
jgi:hypothetical protein